MYAIAHTMYILWSFSKLVRKMRTYAVTGRSVLTILRYICLPSNIQSIHSCRIRNSQNQFPISDIRPFGMQANPCCLYSPCSRRTGFQDNQETPPVNKYVGVSTKIVQSEGHDRSTESAKRNNMRTPCVWTSTVNALHGTLACDYNGQPVAQGERRGCVNAE